MATLAILISLFAFRYLAAIDAGISHTTALRTYAFWAVVTAPTAYVADVLIRTILNYRIVRLTLARVQSNSRRR